MAQTTISCLWNQPQAAVHYAAAVSLHSHTNCSKESLGFIEEFAQRWSLLQWALEHQYKRARVPVDLSQAYWTPPLTPEVAFDAERGQIENGLGLRGLVAITDHDSIEAPLHLRRLEETRNLPISLEWAVPFGDAIFHLGVHNLPPRRAENIMAELAAYTQQPDPRILPELIAMLDEMPEVMIIFNHPLWDLRTFSNGRFQSLLEQFLQENVGFFHAFELNATRSWKENERVVDLAERWRRIVISGGDRHGCEPSGALNLTHARSFVEFIQEVRRDKLSRVLFMPQYAESLCMRTVQTLLDVIREYPEYPVGCQRWDDRVFHPDLANNGADRPVSSYWKAPPKFLRRIFAMIRLLEKPGVRRVMARMLPGRAEHDFRSDAVEVAPEVAYEAIL